MKSHMSMIFRVMILLIKNGLQKVITYNLEIVELIFAKKISIQKNKFFLDFYS